ncbi:uncharacterized protein LOC103711875 [Phoenix dactylifera]|uniref:Uncharacterized protein LOC103711875 n=1 Tax=Phoenix dactylifera TaxID=42345 RepID=A0A8B7CCP5_PHODC|nr:uncharacterized protein LOC103711875 [Phoenix dactylifera]XP_026662308.2 uncharacterized protein LOC103711875 [Phoenix dactylifera]XP_026662309.2 uncharacterized protein LOC103711875 [Phoenix dactylifera]XP_038970893.1 uncharacterized protein LOC103711875 [Phoenix dactylifera]XP_038970894.1 uncharacterized protein LOC103711875 [Phoenix dactylifera]XP_038970895.1 uncharacterized protein LOC103711875 [Phoenix dactylifera]
MKMLIQEEMWKETELKQKPPNVVARLMGLDSLPVQPSFLTVKKSFQEDYSHRMAGALRGHRWQQDEYFHNPVRCEIPHEKNEYKDVYEVRQQPSKISHIKDQRPQKGRYDENSYEKRMTLVRQKFIEAKRLATDENLIQTKEFQGALEVLSSNRDVFLKFLEEPNSLFSKHIHKLQIISPPQTKRITILKPSKNSEVKCDKSVEKQLFSAVEESKCDANKHYWTPSFSHAKAHNQSQPTRIVVLKPSPGKLHDVNNTVKFTTSSTEQLGDRDSYEALGTDGVAGSREIAKEITRQMRENLSSNRRDEKTLLSSVLSNGFVGDESSFNRSESDCMDEEGGNLSDSETVTPTSRRSWDRVNSIGSPYSISSVSRKSYSPESSVIREARKRLSERWALVASNVNNQEQRQTKRSSSTLGEMLAIPEVQKEEENSWGFTVSSSRQCDGEQNLKVLSPCLSAGGVKEGCSGEFSSRNLSRSRSVPSSSAYEITELNVGVSDAFISKPIVHNEIAKSKSGRSSFKGKVSSLFFSRNKTQGQEKSIPSPSVGCDDRLQPGSAEVDSKRNGLLLSVNDNQHKQTALFSAHKNSGGAFSLTTVIDVPNQGTFNAKGAHYLEKPMTCGNSRENQDHPSLVSILQAPVVDDVNNKMSQASKSHTAGHLQALSRSPPIESIARSLSFNCSKLGTMLAGPLKPSRLLPRVEEEQERFMLVQKLLSSAGFRDEKSDMIFTRWHSLDSPLNTMLLDKYLDKKEAAAKCRVWRSNQRLLFDCVNAALLDIGRTAILASYPWAGACRGAWEDGPAGDLVTQKVCELVRNWYSGEEKSVPGGPGGVSLMVDRVVKREMAGREWAELMWLEIFEFSKDIGGLVLEELFEEALSDFTCG